jgi:hypothetical protein
LFEAVVDLVGGICDALETVAEVAPAVDALGIGFWETGLLIAGTDLADATIGLVSGECGGEGQLELGLAGGGGCEEVETARAKEVGR